MTTLKIATINVNGVRAAFRKGMADWVTAERPDIIALQEVRADTTDLLELFAGTEDALGHSWHVLHDAASAKGRAGVAVLSRMAPTAHRTELGPDEFDSAGRWLEVDFDVNGQTLTVISTYVHSGEVDTPKQVEKYKFLDAMTARMDALRADGAKVVVLGDLNVGHTELDIKNWKGNLKNSGFLPEERAWMTQLTTEGGVVDVYRRLQPDTTDACYTWWSNRGQAYAKNVGWRLDYHLATPGLAVLARREAIYKTRKFSDHAPITIEYELKI